MVLDEVEGEEEELEEEDELDEEGEIEFAAGSASESSDDEEVVHLLLSFLLRSKQRRITMFVYFDLASDQIT